MLLHQRIEYSPPTPGNNIYARIPMSSTLWTIIETGDLRSPIFPSRIIEPDTPNSAVFVGVDTSGLLRKGPIGVYRISWRTEADPEDPNPQKFAAIPLDKDVTLAFSHGTSNFLSLCLAGIDVRFSFNSTTRVLSTSWFTPPFTTSWSFQFPRKILTRVISPLLSLTTEDSLSETEEAEQERPWYYRCCLWIS